MKLTRCVTPNGPRWAVDELWLAESLELGSLLEVPRDELPGLIRLMLTDEPANNSTLAPIDADHEVWAAGVTYQRSREARREESDMGDVYDRVYASARPELFFKAPGWRVVGHQQPVRIRADSRWNVPEPELTLVINRFGEMVGYTAGNDLSSRSIEGENPLYLPQAKIYDGSCAIGPAISLLDPESMSDLPIELSIARASQTIFQGSTRTSKMNRKLDELVTYLFRELSFPRGVFLMTGTGIVPPEQFTLAQGDSITVTVGNLTLTNEIGA